MAHLFRSLQEIAKRSWDGVGYVPDPGYKVGACDYAEADPILFR